MLIEIKNSRRFWTGWNLLKEIESSEMAEKHRIFQIFIWGIELDENDELQRVGKVESENMSSSL